MKFAAYMGSVDLDGADGLAVIEVRCKMPVHVARGLAKWMLVKGYPLSVNIPNEWPSSCDPGGDRG